MSLSTDDLRKLSETIVNNPDKLYELDADDVQELQKFTNPLGGPINTSKTYVNMSVVNWREKYMRRMYVTALIGYLYRVLDEYSPEEDILREEYLFKRLSKTLKGDSPEYIQAKADYEERVKRLTETSKRLVKGFLDRNFEFNPDKHLRASHSENQLDPARVSKDELIRNKCANSANGATIETKLCDKPELMYKYTRGHLLNTYQCVKTSTETLKSTLAALEDPNNSITDLQGILIKNYMLMNHTLNDLKTVAEPLSSMETLNACMVDPPVDLYHQLDRYISNHYEGIREVVSAVYDEKPDVEYSVQIYSTHKTPEAARDYRIKHNNEFKTEVFTLESGITSLLGPFKENRDRIDYFNKNTEILKRMLEQLELDHKLGKDLMEKQVRAKKRKNIEEAGPDHPSLASYSKTMNIVQTLGAKKILTQEDQMELERATKEAQVLREDYEVPEDAIQVDMFYPRENESGEIVLSKTKFYTQSEAPLHMQEGSQYADQYQPVRKSGVSVEDGYKTKVIVGKHGKKLEIQVPK